MRCCATIRARHEDGHDEHLPYPRAGGICPAHRRARFRHASEFWQGEGWLCLIRMARRRAFAYATDDTLEETRETALRIIQQQRPRHNVTARLSWYMDRVRLVEPSTQANGRLRHRIGSDEVDGCWWCREYVAQATPRQTRAAGAGCKLPRDGGGQRTASRTADFNKALAARQQFERSRKRVREQHAQGRVAGVAAR
jgi:hypothetical protein